MADLLRELPRLFLLQTAGAEGDCTRITFAPNPQFQEASFQDRVIHAMSGVLLIHNADKRLCGIDAHLDHGVEFGFGLLGKVSDQSHFSVARGREVCPTAMENNEGTRTCGWKHPAHEERLTR